MRYQMKKKYINPAITAISLCTPHLLTVSQNEYSNNQGLVHFETDEVDAGDGD